MAVYKVTFESVDEGKRYHGDYICADTPEEYYAHLGVTPHQKIRDHGNETYESCLKTDQFGKYHCAWFRAGFAPHVWSKARQERQTARLNPI